MKISSIKKMAISQIEPEDLFESIFGLNPLETAVYKLLVKESGLSAAEVGKKLGKDRSTAYRCLRHLIACGICYKKNEYIENGGYYHIYFAVPPKEVRMQLKKYVDDWLPKIKDAINKFARM